MKPINLPISAPLPIGDHEAQREEHSGSRLVVAELPGARAVTSSGAEIDVESLPVLKEGDAFPPGVILEVGTRYNWYTAREMTVLLGGGQIVEARRKDLSLVHPVVAEKGGTEASLDRIFGEVVKPELIAELKKVQAECDRLRDLAVSHSHDSVKKRHREKLDALATTDGLDHKHLAGHASEHFGSDLGATENAARERKQAIRRRYEVYVAKVVRPLCKKVAEICRDEAMSELDGIEKAERSRAEKYGMRFIPSETLLAVKRRIRAIEHVVTIPLNMHTGFTSPRSLLDGIFKF